MNLETVLKVTMISFSKTITGLISLNSPEKVNVCFHFSGRKFDKDGHLRQWWSKKATKNFNEKTKCFIDQYNQYIQTGTNLTVRFTSFMINDLIFMSFILLRI